MANTQTISSSAMNKCNYCYTPIDSKGVSPILVDGKYKCSACHLGTYPGFELIEISNSGVVSIISPPLINCAERNCDICFRPSFDGDTHCTRHTKRNDNVYLRCVTRSTPSNLTYSQRRGY
jgi:hypothetical protein